jgi:hypothetical protein
MISTRFAPIVCALVGLALVPTLIHSYAGYTTHDGRSTSAIPPTLAEYRSAPSGRNATWGQRRFDSFDWIERSYTAGARNVRLTVIRSYDLKALYHHPELAVTYGISLAPESVQFAPDRPTVPVHVLSSSRGDGTLAMYALEYESRFIADPIRFQLRTAAELLFSGRRAMTLFFVTDTTGQSAGGLNGTPAAAVLFHAIDSFVQTAAQQ